MKPWLTTTLLRESAFALNNAFRSKFSHPCSSLRQFHSFVNLRAPISAVGIDKKSLQIQVSYTDDATEETFPWHFLQDNCTCPECFHQASQSRKKRMTTMDLNKTVDSAAFGEDGNSVTIKWSDGHSGTFTETWLRQRSFSLQNIRYRRTGLRDNPTLVGSDHGFKRWHFESSLLNASQLQDSLLELCNVGCFLLEEAPREVGQLKRLADVIGFIRTTHYGNEFTVRSIPDAVNLAYTSEALTVHTDLPYYAYPPGTQALHCIKQFDGDGGESLLVDGFAVAEYMKQNPDPKIRKMYANLRDIPVEFYDIGEDYTKFHKVHHSPTFVESSMTGKIDRIVYSNQQLSSFLPVELDKVNELYEALKTFTDLCYDDRFLMRFKLKEGKLIQILHSEDWKQSNGDVLFFDNWRYLHGRSAFDPSQGERHLEGCYIDWDEIFSRIHVISDTKTT